MKKVGRLRLSELEGRMDTLTKAEQHEYLGGNNTWRIYGGYLYEVEGGTLLNLYGFRESALVQIGLQFDILV